MQTYVTPIIAVEYAHVKEPDTAFNKQGGIYQLDGLFDRKNEEHRKFVKFLQSLAPENAQNKVWKLPSQESPHVAVKFKQNARVQDNAGKTYEGFQPVVYDAKGQKLAPQDIPLMGNGTKVRVRVEPRPYDLKGGGVRLRPVAIQIVELVEYVPESKDDDESDPMGFGAVDGGYVADQGMGFDAVEQPVQSQQPQQRPAPQETAPQPQPQPVQSQPQDNNGMPDFEEF